MRLLALLAAVFAVAGNVLADSAPEPPPKGKKYVNVEISAAVDGGVTGYVFVMSVAEGQGAGPPHVSYSSIKLGEKPVALSAYGKTDVVPDPLDRRRKGVSNLFAIPVDAAKKYATERELTDAVAAGTVPGMHRLGLVGIDIIALDDKRAVIPWKYTITAIDPKTGIAVKKERDGKPFEGKEPQARDASGMHWLMGGVFASAAIVSLGLWLAGRQRSSRASIL
jgi:hypothetical protein